ncbi:tetratricopeptide repeat-containing diguanylate cyclase [Catenuloplanes atrovinosus]|uniref:Diguanylate cyclase (GGDEF)-like protein n=1 Tax=Catenuloplanes atrovinosus TaxID=137266 RepID=A0AAE4C8A7_9ACTN|nr:diguanylate cyclase [Catenuloplanes atrovinosus]MDR7274452.1 diguanylate cyclase (GGDEF)-like protein [Catenuloplanes atrovinosus]
MSTSGVTEADRRPSTATELYEEAERARTRGDYRSGVALARRAADLSARHGDVAGQAAALRLAANQLLRVGEQEAAITACTEATGLFESIGDERGICETLTVQAIPFNDLGLHEEALDALDRARRIAQRLDDRALLYWVHNRTGVVHAAMGDLASSNECLRHALAVVDPGDDEARFCVLNNLGDNAVYRIPQLRELGREDEADELLETALGHVRTALELAEAANHPYRQSIVLDNFGMLMAHRGEYGEAFTLVENSRMIALAHGYRSLESAALQHQAQIRLLRGDCAIAVLGLLEALERAKEAKEKPMTMAIHLQLSQAYERIGDFKAALTHYRSYHALERESHNDVAAVRARMMVHMFELDNARLEADNARLESELHRMRSAELEQQALTDALTGLANRRAVDQRLPELATLAAATGRPFCLAIADVDHFKSVNDRFGHAAGDDVLRRLGALLREHVRGIDLVARLGGEEFLVAFEGVDLPEATHLAEKLRLIIQNHDWSTLQPGLAVTVSIGVAECEDGDHTALLPRADARLYAAKRAGRNRVTAEG